jgi:hypothetical protein
MARLEASRKRRGQTSVPLFNIEHDSIVAGKCVGIDCVVNTCQNSTGEGSSIILSIVSSERNPLVTLKTVENRSTILKSLGRVSISTEGYSCW